MSEEFEKEINRLRLRVANSESRTLLEDAAARLHAILQDEVIEEGTPIEASTAMELAIEAIKIAHGKLKAVIPAEKRAAVPPGGPTRQQGQFLAFIREYMMRNHAGVAPTHANLQRFFNLTAPSVNSMLIRLERRGFIQRITGKARGIELTVNPVWIPPLDRPFRLC